MPQLDPAVFAPQLFWLAVSFGILYFLMSRIALPRIGAVLDERSGRLAADFAAAQEMKDKAEAAAQAYETELAQARQRAQALAKDTQDKLTAESDAARRALDARLAAHMSKAEEEILAKRTAAMANVQSIATETASAIVAELAGIKAKDRDVKKAVEASLAEAV